LALDGAHRERDATPETLAAAPVQAGLVSLWQRIALAELQGVPTEAEQIERAAAREGFAADTIEAAALRALAEEQGDDPDASLQTARRAMRMARTEGVPEGEHLAALVLARVRRRANQAHLAARILGALRKYALPEWHRWIDWELLLCTGGTRDALSSDVLGHGGAAPVLAQWLAAAERGDRHEFDQLTGNLEALVHGFAPALGDVRDALLALDPEANATGSPFERWRAGSIHTLPPAVSGLAAASAPGGAIACAIAYPDRPGVRVLRVGAALASGAAPPIQATAAKHARTQVLVAALALAGAGGLAEEDAFRKAYDFPYVAERHQGTFHVAIHRARAYVEGHAEIARDGGRLRMLVARPLALPDPRCVQPTAEQVLRCIAREGRMAARSISDALGISIRSAQSALEELVQNGSCQRHKIGRAVEYAVEDTTFQEPTAHR
jgi:hypothetical protein